MIPMSGYRQGTGFRPTTGSESINRPMTAVRGAGYTSHGKVFDPLNQAASAPTPPLELQKDESLILAHISIHSILYVIYLF